MSGLLTVARASQNFETLKDMVRKQQDKANKEGERGERAKSFYDRLLKSLDAVAAETETCVRQDLKLEPGIKLTSDQKKDLADFKNQMISVFMTHLAAEHRWKGARHVR